LFADTPDVKRLLLFLALSVPVFAQTYTYTASQTTVLAGAAEVLTLQVPGNSQPPRLIVFYTASLYCSVACTITVERDGTAATTTSIATVAVNRQHPASITKAFKTSNVGAGTVLSSFTLAAGSGVVLDLTAKSMSQGSDNLTFRTSSITGTVQIQVQWTEN